MEIMGGSLSVWPGIPVARIGHPMVEGGVMVAVNGTFVLKNPSVL